MGSLCTVIESLRERYVQNRGIEAVDLEELEEYDRLLMSEDDDDGDDDDEERNAQEIDKQFSGDYLFVKTVSDIYIFLIFD